MEQCLLFSHNFVGARPGARSPGGRSAGRSATPIFQPERDPERNSENSAGARLERNSDFTRSANTLGVPPPLSTFVRQIKRILDVFLHYTTGYFPVKLNARESRRYTNYCTIFCLQSTRILSFGNVGQTYCLMIRYPDFDCIF